MLEELLPVQCSGLFADLQGQQRPRLPHVLHSVLACGGVGMKSADPSGRAGVL